MHPAALPAWPERDSRHLLVSSAQMAALEEQLFASGLPVEALMEKAALAVTRRLLEQHGAWLAQHGALVLVGPGHNGGDGLVIARELHLAGVATAIWSPFDNHKPLTATHLRHALWLGIPRLHQPPAAHGPELWIDALLGIGQRRAPDAALEALLEARQQRRPGALVAVDVPTGLCADSGRPTGTVSAQASTTYAIGLVKIGLVQDPALAAVGALEWIDLGLPRSLLETLPKATVLGLGQRDLADRPRPALDPAASKYQRGRLLVVAGSEAYRGAASLVLAGATSSGCGSLRAALPAGLASSLWQQHPHVVVSQTLACHHHGSLRLDPLLDLDPRRLDALLIGPGIGPLAPPVPQTGPGEADGWQSLLTWPGLLVLDADGLNRLAGPVAQSLGLSAGAWLQQRLGPTWITPHPGEFARLFPELAHRGHDAATAPDAAAAAARLSGASVLLKGARSVVAAPDGRRWQLLEAAPSSARAGLGDVLAGHAAGLGAMAMAVTGDADASWLAAAGLAHAQAGLQLGTGGHGAASPMAVAQQLAKLC
ncbi:NAD(P)H-hydrate epimerase [Cyanobium sp. FACHB-13342]|uniref:NAD(P)H-hydrate epimerase n=1 Tax=Cyanobium sp. FACHB-13342 TaxID=2692793 RepID=UPI00321F8E8E